MTGAELWCFRIAETYEGHDQSEDGPLSTPTIHDGVVYGLGPWGYLVALRLDDGEEIWSRHVVEDLGAKEPFAGFASRPAVVGGVVVVQTGGPDGHSITGLDRRTGEDATEPDVVGEGTAEAYQVTMHPTALGSGARMMNAYALVNSQAVYEGQRSAAPDQRVFILTRSAFARIQRYSSATWSGDVSSSWGAFQDQIPAGLNFTLSGIPYWTTDVGGFAVPRHFSTGKCGTLAVRTIRPIRASWRSTACFTACCPTSTVSPDASPTRMAR